MMNTPEEMREYYGDNSFSAVEMGIYRHWQRWIEATQKRDTRVDWSDFFDGCFLVTADANRVQLCINRVKYHSLADDLQTRELLEQSLFDVFGIPFRMKLTATDVLP